MMIDVKEKDKTFVADTYARFDLALVSGKGSLVYDEKGKEYIDLATGIAVNSFGVADEGVKNAVMAQLNKIQHTSNLYYSEPCAVLAEMLCARTGAKKVFFGNSGAEANECAIKVARKWSLEQNGGGRSAIITLKNSFHGRTLTTLSATGQEVFHQYFHPFTEGFVFAEANNLDSVKTLAEENGCAAVMMELVQGEGGVMALDPAFVKGVEQLCREKNMLLILDEVQTGNGRTGTLYAYEQYGVQPDIITTAKGLGGGLPIGAAILFERAQNTLTHGTHGSTFGGNPIACAAAISVLERIDENLLKEVREKSAYIFEELEGADGVESVSGLGLMIGIQTKKPVDEVLKACMQAGALPIKAKQKLRLLPALNIGWEELKKGVEIIKRAVKGE